MKNLLEFIAENPEVSFLVIILIFLLYALITATWETFLQ